MSADWFQAVREGNMGVINKCLESFQDNDDDSDEVAEQKMADEKKFIEQKNAEGQTALHVAAQYGQSTVGSMLVERDASVQVKDNNGNTPLHMAAIHDRRLAISFLMWGGSDAFEPNERGNTALHEAALNGAKDCVWQIIAKCDDSEGCQAVKNNQGLTAIELAEQKLAETQNPVYSKIAQVIKTGDHVD